MLTDYLPDLTAVAIAVALASLQGAFSYLVFRGLEKLWFAVSYIGLVLMPVLLVAGFKLGQKNTHWFFGPSDNALAAVLVCALVLGVPAIFGGWFHRSSGGYSKTWRGALALILAAEFLSLTIAVALLYVVLTNYAASIPAILHPVAFLIYLFGAIGYPALLPLGIWIWRSLRLRPGIDKGLEES